MIVSVSKKARAFYWAVFDGFETACANFISKYKESKYLKKYMTKEPIPTDFKKAYMKYWKPYKIVRGGVKYAWYYASQNGIQDPRYIPNNLYYTKIDQYFNDRKLGWGFNDKNYYSKIFAGIPQPKTVVRKIKGLLFDEDYRQITVDEAVALLLSEPEVICKPTLETGSGRGIRFWNTQTDAGEIRVFLMNPDETDYAVQAILKQHAELNRVHEGSINTIRISSLLMDDGVHILSSVLRMGVGNAKVDNATAGDNAQYDGMTCGINSNGRLKKYAYGYYTGKKFDRHPQGLVFDGYTVPCYDKAVELVKKVHPTIAHFRLVSWDVAIDENENAVLIEANMRNGTINFHQFNNGPLFGDLTERVLKEVFVKN